MAASSAMPAVAVQATTVTGIESGSEETDSNTDGLTEDLEIVVEGETVTQEDGDWMSNEDMLDGYVTELIQGYGISPLGTSARDVLEASGETAAVTLYDLLKAQIEKVAAGEITSTEFTFTAEQLGISGYYTSSSLGGVTIISNNSITEEAVTALSNTIGLDDALRKSLSALLTDCPYDLYWYDKTSGTSTSNYYIGAVYSSGEWALYITSDITFCMSVSADYRASTADEPQYTVDSSAVEIANTAIVNAQAIVDKYAGCSDYEKLYAYLEDV